MIKWLLSKLFPPLSEREMEQIYAMEDMKEHGVEIVTKENGGWKLEFKNDEAFRWYYRKATKGFEDFKIKEDE